MTKVSFDNRFELEPLSLVEVNVSVDGWPTDYSYTFPTQEQAERFARRIYPKLQLEMQGTPASEVGRRLQEIAEQVKEKHCRHCNEDKMYNQNTDRWFCPLCES